MNEKKKHKKEKMSDEDSEWQEVINLNNCQNTESRKQIKQILDELKQIDGLVMQKICTHDLSAKLNGRVLCRICPLKQGWSGSITTGKIKRYTVNQFIEELQKAHKEMPKRPCLPLKNIFAIFDNFSPAGPIEPITALLWVSFFINSSTS